MVFERASNGKLKCSVCQCWLRSNSEKIRQDHLNGKKHQTQLRKVERKEHQMKHSVYVKGFDPLLTNLDQELSEYFERLAGPIKDIYIDKNSHNYCIVEFSDLDSVSKSLMLDKKLFHDKPLAVRRRKSPVAPLNNAQSNDDRIESVSSGLNETLQKASNIEDQMKALKNFLAITPTEMELRSMICELLRSVLEEAYPACDVKTFGSSSNTLGCHGCDLDVTLLTVNTVSDDNGKVDEDEVLKEVRDILERYAPGFKSVKLVTSTRNCSVVKMHHSESKLNVDLSLNNRLAIENTSLLKQYVTADENLPALFVTVRHWASVHSLGGRSGTQINNYTLTLMLIHYLQQLEPPYLLCLQTCHQLPMVDINQWNCSFCKEHAAIGPSQTSLGTLLLGFFTFYANFHFDERIIAIHTNVSLQRSDAYEGLIDDPGVRSTAIVVQDPFKLSHNVAQNMTEKGLGLFIRACQSSRVILSGHSANLLFVFSTKDKPKGASGVDQSTVFTISLPNCNQPINIASTAQSTSKCCLEFVRGVLVDDLQMSIYEQPCNLDQLRKVILERQNIKDLSENAIREKVCDNPHHLFKANTTGSTKRKLADDDHADGGEPDQKKIKTVTQEKDISLYVYASNEALRLCRKNEHLKYRLSATSDIEKNHERLALSDKQTPAERIVAPEPTIALAAKVVLLHKATTENSDVCKIILEPFSDDTVQTNAEDFRVFYAYMKKTITAVFQ